MIPTAGRARRTLAPYFPLPLVGAAVLLAVLIVLTPNLLSTGSPAAGSLESQAELIIDRAPSENVTHLYLRGLGLVRYANLSLLWSSFNGTSAPGSPIGLGIGGAVGGTDVLSVNEATGAASFVVNATAVYVDATGLSVTFTGDWAFVWSSGLLVTTPYGSVAGASPTAPSQLPLILLLSESATGGGP